MNTQPTDITGENPEALARHAILVLEQAIHRDFGVDVQAGVELEVSYRLPHSLQEKLRPATQAPGKHEKNDLLHGKKRGGNYISARARGHSSNASKTILPIDVTALNIPLPETHSYTPMHTPFHPDHRLVATEVSDPIFPDSAWITYSYPEKLPQSSSGGEWTQYEHVITHLAPHSQVPFGKGRFTLLAHATEMVRRTIAMAPNARTKFAEDPLHDRWLSRLANEVTDRSTEAVGPTHCNQGMHVNISLSHPKHAISGSVIKEELLEMLMENHYLFLPSEKSRARSKNICKSDPVKIKPDRIEIREPGMESNPYYVMLVTLAGVYHALEMQGFSKKTGLFEARNHLQSMYSRPKGNVEYETFMNAAPKRFFDGHHLMREMLDELEPSLGTRFEDAIRNKPPGHEKSRRAAGIIGAGEALHMGR